MSFGDEVVNEMQKMGDLCFARTVPTLCTAQLFRKQFECEPADGGAGRGD